MADPNEVKDNVVKNGNPSEQGGGVSVREQAKKDAELIAKSTDQAERATFFQKIIQQIKEGVKSARNFLEGEAQGKGDQNSQEAQKALSSLIRVTEAAKANLPIARTEKAQQILQSLADQKLTERSASAILSGLGEYLLGEKEISFSGGNQPKTDFEKALIQLKQTGGAQAYETIGDAIKQKAVEIGDGKSEAEISKILEQLVPPDPSSPKPIDGDEQVISNFPPEVQQQLRNMSQEERNQLFDQYRGMTPEQIRQKMMNSREEKIQENMWEQEKMLFEQYTNQEQLELIRLMHNPKQFVNYLYAQLEGNTEAEKAHIAQEKNHIRHHLHDRFEKAGIHLSPSEFEDRVDTEFREHIGEKIIGRVGGVLNGLFAELQHRAPGKYFQEIVQEDFYKGIQTTFTRLTRQITKLRTEIVQMESDPEWKEKIKKVKLVKHYEEDIYVDDLESKEAKSPQKFARIRPLVTSKKVDLSEFVDFLGTEIQHQTHRIEYLHNGSAIFQHPAHGEGGFWEGLAKYAEEFKTADLDSIYSQPDGPLIYEAQRLYDKFLDNEYGRHNWINPANLFTPMAGENETQLERRIEKFLRMKYPDKLEYSDDRIRAAVKQGVGMSRAVFLTEPEKVAYAEPALQSDGSFEGSSYYTNDVGALMVFNPNHTIKRWNGQHVLFPFLFTPVADDNQKFAWNHNNTWKQMSKWQDSYINGRQELDSAEFGSGGKLYIDQFLNFGKIGGMFQRKGWRLYEALKPYYVFRQNEQGQQLKDINVIETWKNIEKIGYEALFSLVGTIKSGSAGGYMKDAFLKTTDRNSTLYKERMELFKYLYTSPDYFAKDGSNKQDLPFESYIESMRKAHRASVMANLAKRKPGSDPSQLTESAIERAVSEQFLSRTLSRVVARRFPTKFLRLDRDRFQKDGKSRWTQVRETVGMGSDEFRDVMDKLAFCESALREEVSQEIKTRLKGLDAKEIDLRVGHNIEYHLNPTRIRSYLEGLQVSEAEIQNVLKTYGVIMEKYGKDAFLDGFNSQNYKFTFGLEDTDLGLLPMRMGGPRVLGRTVGDIKGIDVNITNKAIMGMMNAIQTAAVDGKHDFGPIIQVLKTVQGSFLGVHGPGDAYEAVAKMAGAAVNFFRKDTKARALFGLFGLGKSNSIAAEVIGRNMVWEWDATTIHRFGLALQANGLLPGTNQDWARGEHRYPTTITIPFTGKVVEIPKQYQKFLSPFIQGKLKPEFKYTRQWFEQNYGGGWKDITFDMVNHFVPLALVWVMYSYMKKAFEDLEGKKK